MPPRVATIFIQTLYTITWQYQEVTRALQHVWMILQSGPLRRLSYSLHTVRRIYVDVQVNICLDALHLTTGSISRFREIAFSCALLYFNRVTLVRMMAGRALDLTPSAGVDTSRGVLKNGVTEKANVHYRWGFCLMS